MEIGNEDVHKFGGPVGRDQPFGEHSKTRVNWSDISGELKR